MWGYIRKIHPLPLSSTFTSRSPLSFPLPLFPLPPAFFCPSIRSLSADLCQYVNLCKLMKICRDVPVQAGPIRSSPVHEKIWFSISGPVWSGSFFFKPVRSSLGLDVFLMFLAFWGFFSMHTGLGRHPLVFVMKLHV